MKGEGDTLFQPYLVCSAFLRAGRKLCLILY